MTDRTFITETTKEAYRKTADKLYGQDGEIEIDLSAEISRGCGSGAYVQAWVWVNDRDLEPEAGPSYDVWVIEPKGEKIYSDAYPDEWVFDARFTCEDDPDGKGARRSAHEHARGLRKEYPKAFIAVRQSSKGMPPVPREAQ